MRITTGIFFFCLLGGFLSEVSAQQPSQVINGPGIRYTVSNAGVIFQNQGNASFEAPIDSGIQGILSSGLWIAGKNGGILYLSAACYDSSGRDFQPGPIDRSSGVADDTSYWNYVWTVDSAMIEEHKTLYNNTGYQAPWSIANWPGSNTRPGDYNPILAPFVDLNSNGIYDPSEGEVPYIQGDQATYMIYNDQRSTHQQSGGNAMGVEVYAMVYTDRDMPDVVFVKYRIVNRSQRTYDSVFAGVYTDFLLGKPDDNFISTDSIRHSYFCYNADPYDSGGYADRPAVIGVRFLQDNLNRTIGFNWDREDTYGWPTEAAHYFQYLNARWKDGSTLQDPQSVQSSYYFQGDPCSNVGWTEYGSSGTIPGRRNMLGSSGPGSLAPGDVVALDVAFIFTRKEADVQANVCAFQQDADQVYAYWKNTLSGAAPLPERYSIGVYPNPAGKELMISGMDLSQIAWVSVFDSRGKEVLTSSLKEEKLLVADLQAGVYFIRIQTKSGLLYSTRFQKTD